VAGSADLDRSAGSGDDDIDRRLLRRQDGSVGEVLRVDDLAGVDDRVADHEHEFVRRLLGRGQSRDDGPLPIPPV
jgi:hypothetical protein